jgi:hypothetical protein
MDEQNPTEGGSYLRNEDGTLAKSAPATPVPDTAEPAASASTDKGAE